MQNCFQRQHAKLKVKKHFTSPTRLGLAFCALADVYIYLTGGQSKFEFSSNNNVAKEAKSSEKSTLTLEGLKFTSIKANKSDVIAHKKRLKEIKEKNNVETIWNNYS